MEMTEDPLTPLDDYEDLHPSLGAKSDIRPGSQVISPWPLEKAEGPR